LFDVPPPENDSQAFSLGKKIREWIKQGRPEPGEIPVDDDNDDSDEQEVQKHDKEEKPKKKGRFGFLRR